VESVLGDWVVIDKPYVPRLATDDNGRSALQAAQDGEDVSTISRLVQLERINSGAYILTRKAVLLPVLRRMEISGL
jgi:hypothetical protein